MLDAVLLRSTGDDGAALDTLEITVEPADADTDTTLVRLGFTCGREIRQLRRALPLERSLVEATPPIALRPFRPGQDDAAWLAVNHRAFVWHPEQGDLGQSDLDDLVAAPWFDAEGFLLHEVDGELAGFCWTKVHSDTVPPQGEIFAIGVDPGHQGAGLGRALVVAGLEHLAASGLRLGMLWVEADNAPALALYDRLGFECHHTKRYYRRSASA